MSIYFLIRDGVTISIGELPMDYMNISSLHGCQDKELSDLTWANLPGVKFIKASADALTPDVLPKLRSYHAALTDITNNTEMTAAEMIDSCNRKIIWTKKTAELNSIVETLVKKLTTKYSPEEIDQWTNQIIEAKNYTYHPEDTTGYAMLAAIATNRGVELQSLVEKVIAKQKDYSMLLGQILGNKQRIEDLLESALTTTEISSINLREGWPL